MHIQVSNNLVHPPGRGGTKQNEKIYINHLSPLQSRWSIILSISVFNHIVWSPRIALTAVLLISFYIPGTGCLQSRTWYTNAHTGKQ
jgi:hypothetical protein